MIIIEGNHGYVIRLFLLMPFVVVDASYSLLPRLKLRKNFQEREE